MRITFASMKGGVAKTTSAIHLASNLSALGPTLLVDADPNQSASRWASRSSSPLPFPVMSITKAVSEARRYQHLVMDTKARPDLDELRDLSEGCDLLVIPTTPDALSMEGMMLTIDALRKIEADNFRVLLTIVPPVIAEGRQAREDLTAAQIPVFQRGIRRLVAFQRAAHYGTTVERVKGDLSTLGARDYEAVFAELLAAIEHRSLRATA